MSNGPMNRKKKVTGTASADSMQTHGEGRQEGPVGQQDGYQERKEQANPANQQGRANANTQQPFSRPTGQTGMFTGSMNTQGQGMGSTRPQQSRPAASSQPTTSRPVSYGQTQQSAQQSQQQSRPLQSAQQSQNQTAGTTTRASSGKSGISPILNIVILAVLLLGGGGGLSGLFGGGSNTSNNNTTNTGSTQSGNTGDLLGTLLGGLTDDTTTTTNTTTTQTDDTDDLLGALLGDSTGDTATTANNATASSSSILSGYGASDLLSMLGGSWFGDQAGYSTTSNTTASTAAYGTTGNGTLNRNVAAGSRAKYTTIQGNGKDTMTIMVYMCGADLESKSAMGTKDLNEMLSAKFGTNIRLIVYTGGATKWQNNKISSSVNQIWRIANGKLTCLEDNAGTASMTHPNTLSTFIQYCAQNFSANRYALILWDHGSGSVSGYGYDEKNPRSGQMSLAGIDQALKAGGVKFDFLGFDACLMATVENALMASKYADYLIASEETEPGIGWYYTDWLTALGNNSSLSTLDIGKQIADDFVEKCGSQCRGQQTTLSVVDLAEVENTVPAKLTAFAKSITSMISQKDYSAVSNARSGCREFASSSRIDQVDLTDLCNRMGTKESSALAEVLQSAVKYNRYNNISNSYGLSIYFPYQKVSSVDKAVSTYSAIGMDSSYSQAIRAFAQVEASGQAVNGGSTSAASSLFGAASTSSDTGDMLSALLSAFLGGGYDRLADLSADNADFLSESALSQEDLTEYLTLNMLDDANLVFKQNGDRWVMDMEPSQWALVHSVDQNMFYDNGVGYVDLGLDNLFTIEDGFLVADMDYTWLAINGQPVAYYHETSEYENDDSWRISGRVPALLNGERVELLVVFDSAHEDGYVAGARAVYDEDVVAKEMIVSGAEQTAYDPDAEIMEVADLTILKDGDTIQFLADLYDYDQNFVDSYAFGNPVTVSGDVAVSNVYLPDASKCLVTYRITDIYNQAHWTPVIGK